DANQTLIYRGAVSDQYGIDYSLDQPRTNYLIDATRDYLDGKNPVITATMAPGCEINLKTVARGRSVSSLTYHKDISRILQKNCVKCHNDFGIAPFSLEFYDEVVDRARVIKRVVTEGTMPPWFARDLGDGESPWLNDH
ncbi:MAG: histidine kinase, partial [Verrucomicrobiota bacterium]